MNIGKLINDFVVKAVYYERRIDPLYRDRFDALFQRPLSAAAQALIDLNRRDEHLALAEERSLPDEKELTDAIIEQMARFTRREYQGRVAQRAGNTKTYGVIRGSFEVLPDLPARLGQGVFGTLRTYPIWVRFAGPGPLTPPDIQDNGILSIGIKLMGVEGDKLIDDEKMTQDFTGISAPTFTTPNVAENLKLQRHVFRGTPLIYFINPFDSHVLDLIMQGLYSRTHANPLEVTYYSCAAYLLGEGQAMHYAIRPRSATKSKVPVSPSDNYLREAMTRTLSKDSVEFDFLVQLQRDAYRMPIENASVEWPERLSSFLPVATLRLPVQKFDSKRQLDFAGNLSFNPWHSLPAHRPLGNQNRARKSIYLELSRLRQEMNGEARLEPTGDEVFDD